MNQTEIVKEILDCSRDSYRQGLITGAIIGGGIMFWIGMCIMALMWTHSPWG